MCIKGYAYALATVAPRTSCFLVIALQAFGYVVVYDEAHVGLVDAHAKSYGGHNHVDAFHEEVVLRLRSGGRVEASMIGCRLDVVGT